MGISKPKPSDYIEVEDSKTEYKILRKDLSHYLMKIFSENVDAEYPQRIFETGRIFEDLKEKENLFYCFVTFSGLGNFGWSIHLLFKKTNR